MNISKNQGLNWAPGLSGLSYVIQERFALHICGGCFIKLRAEGWITLLYFIYSLSNDIDQILCTRVPMATVKPQSRPQNKS